MIYEKELSAPVFRSRKIRREISLFCEKKNAVYAEGLHFRAAERGIVCAEGAVLAGGFPVGGLLLNTTGHSENRYIYYNGKLNEAYLIETPPKQLINYETKSGKWLLFALTSDGLYLAEETGSRSISDPADCMCLQGDRIFLAKGERLWWTNPLEPEETEERAQGAGHVDLPSSLGDIIALVPYTDELFLFRKWGVTRFYAPGDTLSFRAEELPFSGGRLREGTVRRCGEKTLFLAQNGLYSLSGGKFSRLSDCGFSALDLTDTVTASCGGKYYATAKFGGEDCIWCVDPEAGCGHLIRAHAEQLAGGHEIVYLQNGKLYNLSERGLPLIRRRECVLRTERSLFGLSPRLKYLDGIVVEGRGSFRVEARGGYGLPRAVCGKAGEPLRFPMPVRGTEFSLDIRTLDEEACLSAVTLDLREETTKW